TLSTTKPSSTLSEAAPESDTSTPAFSFVLNVGSARPELTTNPAQFSFAGLGSTVGVASVALLTSTSMPQALNASTSSSPTRVAFTPPMSIAIYVLSSAGAGVPEVFFSVTSLSEATPPLKPMSPATTVSSLKVAALVTSSAVPLLFNDPPGPTHSVTPVSS